MSTGTTPHRHQKFQREEYCTPYAVSISSRSQEVFAPGNAAMSAPTTIEEWLAIFGLSRLGATFRDNGIDLDVVLSLTDDDLK
jgi:hypothetical protein